MRESSANDQFDGQFKLKALLIDLQGILHVGHSPTTDAVHAIEMMRASRIPFAFWYRGSPAA